MAGLIQQQMAPSAEDEQNEQEPVEGTGLDGSAQHEGMESEAPEAEDESGAGAEAEENNPAFQQALTYAYEALYKNDAAKDVAKQLKASQSLEDGMADVAGSIVQVVDDRTEGAVPDESYGLLMMSILQEVSEIAEAANLDPQPEDVAGAFKKMLIDFAAEHGQDASGLEQAMNQVDPSVFRQAAEQPL